MKVLSLIQPWAYLLCIGLKRIETRSWPTQFRGKLYIHASKSYSAEGEKLWQRFPGKEKFEELTRGAIIGSVQIDNCLLMTEKLIAEQSEQERAMGDWKVGRFAWVCSSPSFLFAPIPAKGQLQLWDFDPDMAPKKKMSQAQLFAIAKSVQARRRKKRAQIDVAPGAEKDYPMDQHRRFDFSL